MKRKGLGRGLEALLKNPEVGGGAEQAVKKALNVAEVPIENSGPQDGKLVDIAVDLLQRGKYQPRRDIHEESLQELADSIKAQGVMQPIVVRPIAKKRYEIIAGERRWRASQIAGLDKIPAVIRDVPDETAIAMAIIENLQREDLNPIEEALALKRFQDEFSFTHQEVADAVGKSRTAVSNALRLLNLGESVRTLLERGDLEMGHARCLLSLDALTQGEVAKHIVDNTLSVRQAEAMVRKLQESNPEKPSKNKTVDPDIKKLQEDLSEKVGVPVSLQHSTKGVGKLVMQYKSLDELDGILKHLGFENA